MSDAAAFANSGTVSILAGRLEEAGVLYRLVKGTERPLIGIKRYGGKYCSACEVTLLRDGEEAAIYAGKVHHAACPLCEKDAAIVDCMCFEWRMAPHRLEQRNVQALKVVDSYGQEQDVKQFLAHTRKCSIQFYEHIEK